MTIAEEYWEKYLYFTQELNKFLLNEDWDMFNLLLEERQKLQEFAPLQAPSEELYAKLTVIERDMRLQLQQKIQRVKNNQQVSRAYENMGQEDTGMWMDRRR